LALFSGTHHHQHTDFCAPEELFRAHNDYPTGTICRECIWGCCYIIFIFPTTFCYYSIFKHRERPHRVFTHRYTKCIRLIISSNGIYVMYIVQQFSVQYIFYNKPGLNWLTNFNHIIVHQYNLPCDIEPRVTGRCDWLKISCTMHDNIIWCPDGPMKIADAPNCEIDIYNSAHLQLSSCLVELVISMYSR